MGLGRWSSTAKRPFVTARKPYSHRGRAVTKTERDVVREPRRRNVNGEPF